MESTVNELYSQLAAAAGVDRDAHHGAAKTGEQRRSVLDGTKLRAAAKLPEPVALADGIRQTFAWFRAARGSLRTMRQDLAGALADCDRAITLRPDYAYAYLCRGNAFDRSGNLDRALADYDRVIALNPNYADAYANRGIVYRKKAQIDDAIANVSRAIAINPNIAGYYSNRGDAFNAKGDLDRALADYDKALAISPGDRYALEKRKAILAAKGELERVQSPSPSPSAATGGAPAIGTTAVPTSPTLRTMPAPSAQPEIVQSGRAAPAA